MMDKFNAPTVRTQDFKLSTLKPTSSMMKLRITFMEDLAVHGGILKFPYDKFMSKISLVSKKKTVIMKRYSLQKDNRKLSSNQIKTVLFIKLGRVIKG